jgi:hypothetical protein
VAEPGRRAGLRIRCPKGRGGSNPPSRTSGSHAEPFRPEAESREPSSLCDLDHKVPAAIREITRSLPATTASARRSGWFRRLPSRGTTLVRSRHSRMCPANGGKLRGSMTWSTERSSGSTGSTTGASWNRSATSRRPSSKLPSRPNGTVDHPRTDRSRAVRRSQRPAFGITPPRHPDRSHQALLQPRKGGPQILSDSRNRVVCPSSKESPCLNPRALTREGGHRAEELPAGVQAQGPGSRGSRKTDRRGRRVAPRERFQTIYNWRRQDEIGGGQCAGASSIELDELRQPAGASPRSKTNSPPLCERPSC